jgi:phenylalanyl-tRNA synthetase beta chain
VGNLITLKTAECEGVEAAGQWLDRVCSARVISVEEIPGANNRKVVVDTGRYGRKTVVCGAPNCREGMLTVYVPIGTKEINGVESDGMLAAGAEIGINRDHDGILDLAAEADLDGCFPDLVIDIDNKSITHRPDLWGHLGMAREVAALTGKKLTDPVDMSLLPSSEDGAIQVEIEEYSHCPRYSALVFENVTVGPSPLWMQCRLESIGLNPINNIVDVTNFVMAELAQPMHAFDQDTLNGNIIYVRAARVGESLLSLNKESYPLDEQALVIADAKGPVAIAGVIGGLDTGVTGKTTRIVFESANFHGGHVRKTSSRLKLRTDASIRFEKAQDPHNTVRGLARALELLRIVSPGIRLVGGLVDNCGPLKSAPLIDLRHDWLLKKLGRPVSTSEVRQILEALEFGVDEPSGGLFRVRVPSWRATKDVSIKEDLAEEVGRMLGYTSITPVAPAVPTLPPPVNPELEYFHHLRDVVSAQGFTEIYNYSFVNEDQVRELGMDPADCVKVLNPIASDQGLLRTSLLAGVLRNVRENARHFDSFRFFEIGSEIHRRQVGDLPHEVARLVACVYAKDGDGFPGLMEAKRLAECVLKGADVRMAEARTFEHPCRTYEVVWRGELVGRLGELHPKLVEGRAAVLDLNLEKIQAIGPVPVRYQPLRRFPTSTFDLSVVTGLRTFVGGIRAAISGEDVLGVEFVMQYVGAPLPEDRKSVSFRITVGADDRTMSADEIGRVRSRIIAALEEAGYELRI